MRPFLHLFRAHLYEFARDRSALYWSWAHLAALALVFPLVGDVAAATPRRVALVAEARGEVSRRLGAALQRLDGFECLAVSHAEAEELWGRGRLAALVSVDPAAERALSSGIAATIDVRYDAARPASRDAVSAIESATRVIEDPNPPPRLLTVAATTHGRAPVRAAAAFLPAAATIGLIHLGVFGTPMPVLLMRALGLLRRLRATPLGVLALVAAPISVRLALLTAQVLIVATVARFLFSARLPPGVGLAAVGVGAAGAATFIAIGLAVAGIARTPEGGSALGSAMHLVIVGFSGILIPIDVFPDALRPLLAASPGLHLWDALRQVTVDAPPLYGLPANLAILAAWFVAAGLVARRTLSLQ